MTEKTHKKKQMKPGEIKKRLEKRRATVEKDIKDNEKQYDSANLAIRKYEIF